MTSWPITAEQDRAHERQMQEWRAEEQAAERLNQPTQYDTPSWESPTKSFLFSDDNDPEDMKLCTASRTGGVSCY